MYLLRLVWFVQHNGGFWWFDDLGWPWPKHPCYKAASESKKIKAAPMPTIPVLGHDWLECRFCGKRIGESHYGEHLARCEMFRVVPHVSDEYDSTARSAKRCEFCHATIKLSRYADHVKRCSERRQSDNGLETAAVPHDVGRLKAKRTTEKKAIQKPTSRRPNPQRLSGQHILARCEFCDVMVKPSRYARHLRKVHGSTVVPMLK